MSDADLGTTTPSTANRIGKQMKRTGQIGSFVQLLLAVAATVTFIVSFSKVGSGLQNPSTSGGLLLALLALIALYGSIYWYYGYVRMSGKLANPNLRPKKADTIKMIRGGVGINLLGLGASILAAESIGGNLFGKSFAFFFPWSAYNPNAFSNMIQPLDIFIVLANTHALAAHFIGLVGSLWLLDRITKPN
jgi:hypothetical protein